MIMGMLVSNVIPTEICLLELQVNAGGGASASTSSMNLSSVLDNAVSSAVDMLTSFQVKNY